MPVAVHRKPDSTPLDNLQDLAGPPQSVNLQCTNRDGSPSQNKPPKTCARHLVHIDGDDTRPFAPAKCFPFRNHFQGSCTTVPYHTPAARPPHTTRSPYACMCGRNRTIPNTGSGRSLTRGKILFPSSCNGYLQRRTTREIKCRRLQGLWVHSRNGVDSECINKNREVSPFAFSRNQGVSETVSHQQPRYCAISASSLSFCPCPVPIPQSGSRIPSHLDRHRDRSQAADGHFLSPRMQPNC